MLSAEDDLSGREVDIDEKWHRLIPSRFPPVDVYARLGPPELAELAKQLEDKTNPRLHDRNWQMENKKARENSPSLQNWNHAPFVYRNPEGSTLLNPGYAVLEMVRGVGPALAWALRRRELFLQRTDEPALNVDMRLLITPVTGRFVDLSDTPISANRDERWNLGQALVDRGARGALFRPLDHPSVLALAVFDRTALGRTVQAAHYRFVWDGSAVRTVYDFTDGSELARDDLMKSSTGLAA
jgi:hypothetical protein